MNYFSYFSFDFSIIVSVLLITAFILNVVFGFIIIFLEPREAGAIWAWLLVLLFVPILGFILYLLFGRQIQRKSIFNLDEQDKIGLEHIINEQIKAIDENNFEIDKPEISNYKHLIHMLLYNNSAFLTTDNKVEMFTDGHDKFDALIEDIRKAESYIHIQYY
ncbi:PLDc N-terminal domain-containing protein, partial [Mammaliicoccus sp. RAM2]